MRVEYDGKLEDFISPQEFNRKFGLENSGRVQRAIDSAVIRYTDKYVPYRTGTLARSTNTATIIGSGEVKYSTPYARRLYYNPQFNFSTEVHELSGAYWFERSMADNKERILKEAKNAIK